MPTEYTFMIRRPAEIAFGGVSGARRSVSGEGGRVGLTSTSAGGGSCGRRFRSRPRSSSCGRGCGTTRRLFFLSGPMFFDSVCSSALLDMTSTSRVVRPPLLVTGLAFLYSVSSLLSSSRSLWLFVLQPSGQVGHGGHHGDCPQHGG
jgi:hypothetical protein